MSKCTACSAAQGPPPPPTPTIPVSCKHLCGACGMNWEGPPGPQATSGALPRSRKQIHSVPGSDAEFEARLYHCLGSGVVRGVGRLSALGLVKPHDYIRPGKEREGCQPEGEDGEGEEEVQRAELELSPSHHPPLTPATLSNPIPLPPTRCRDNNSSS